MKLTNSIARDDDGVSLADLEVLVNLSISVVISSISQLLIYEAITIIIYAIAGNWRCAEAL